MISSNSLDRYTLLQQLGDSTFGYLDLARENSSNSLFVIKTLEKARISDQNDIDRIMREILILRKLAHINIIQLYEIIEAIDYLHLVLEYAEDAIDLQNFITQNVKLSETEAFFLFKQIISALDYIHSQNIVHRDLKPENILITKTHSIKLIGFGLSNFYSNESLMKTPCGSSCYAAPEILSGKLYSGPKADIWSSGIVLYSMLAGKLPFEDENTVVLYEKIINGDYEMLEGINEKTEEVLKRLLEPNPQKRAKLQEIKEILAIGDEKEEEIKEKVKKNYGLSKENGGKVEKEEKKKEDLKNKRKTLNFIQENKLKVSRFSLFAPKEDLNKEKTLLFEGKKHEILENTEKIEKRSENQQEKYENHEKNQEFNEKNENKDDLNRSKTINSNKIWNSARKSEKDRRKTQIPMKSNSDIKKKRLSDVIIGQKDEKIKIIEKKVEKIEEMKEKDEKRDKSKSFTKKSEKIDDKNRRKTDIIKTSTAEKQRRATEISHFGLKDQKSLEKPINPIEKTNKTLENNDFQGKEPFLLRNQDNNNNLLKKPEEIAQKASISDKSESYNINDNQRNSLINSRELVNILSIEEKARRATAIIEKKPESSEEKARRATAKSVYNEKKPENLEFLGKNKENIEKIENSSRQKSYTMQNKGTIEENEEKVENLRLKSQTTKENKGFKAESPGKDESFEEKDRNSSSDSMEIKQKPYNMNVSTNSYDPIEEKTQKISEIKPKNEVFKEKNNGIDKEIEKKSLNEEKNIENKQETHENEKIVNKIEGFEQKAIESEENSRNSSSEKPEFKGNIAKTELNKRKSHTLQAKKPSQFTTDEKNRRKTNFEQKASKISNNSLLTSEEKPRNSSSELETKGKSLNIQENTQFLINKEEKQLQYDQKASLRRDSEEKPRTSSSEIEKQRNSLENPILENKEQLNKRKSHTVQINKESQFKKEEINRRKTNFQEKEEKIIKKLRNSEEKLRESSSEKKEGFLIKKEEILEKNRENLNKSQNFEEKARNSSLEQKKKQEIVEKKQEIDEKKPGIEKDIRPKSQTSQIKKTSQISKEEKARRTTNYQQKPASQNIRRASDIEKYIEKSSFVNKVINSTNNLDKKQYLSNEKPNKEKIIENQGIDEKTREISEKTLENHEKTRENHEKTIENSQNSHIINSNNKAKSNSISYNDQILLKSHEIRRQSADSTFKPLVFSLKRTEKIIENPSFQTPSKKSIKYLESEKNFMDCKEFSSQKNDIISLEKSEKKAIKDLIYESPERKSLFFEENSRKSEILSEKNAKLEKSPDISHNKIPEKSRNKAKSLFFPAQEHSFIEDNLIKRNTLRENILTHSSIANSLKKPEILNENYRENQENEASKSQSFSSPDKAREDFIKENEERPILIEGSFQGKNLSENKYSEKKKPGKEILIEEIQNGKRPSLIEMSSLEKIYDILRKDRMSFYNIKKTLAQPIQEKEEFVELNNSILSKAISERKR